MPRQFHAGFRLAENVLLLELSKPVAELVEDVDAKLVAIVSDLELAGLQLQDHFADKAVARRSGQRAVERNLAAIQGGNVILPAVQVLNVHSAQMPERRHTGAEHVRPVP